MSLFKRGDTFWYEFIFLGKRIRESAKTHSKTVAKEAEKDRRRSGRTGYRRFRTLRRAT